MVSIVNWPWDWQWFFERHKCVVCKMILCVVCKTHHWESHNSWTNPTTPTLIKPTTTRKKKKRKEANPTPPTAHHHNPRPQTHQLTKATTVVREGVMRKWVIGRGTGEKERANGDQCGGERGENKTEMRKESWEWKGRIGERGERE